MALAGKKASIYMASGESVAFTDEAMVADANRIVYTIGNALKAYWDPEAPVTVEVDGETANPATYSVAYAGGRIRFHEAQASGAVVTVSGKAFPTISQIGQGRSWEIALNVDTEETTVFGDDWKTYQALLNGGTVRLERFAVDLFFIEELFRPLYLLLYVSEDTEPRLECIGRLTSDSIQAATRGLIGETVEFIIDGEPNLVEAS